MSYFTKIVLDNYLNLEWAINKFKNQLIYYKLKIKEQKFTTKFLLFNYNELFKITT